MDLYYPERKSEKVLMAESDLAVLRELFHSLNDMCISLSPLNSSIALLEKYIEENCVASGNKTQTWTYSGNRKPDFYKSVVWKNSNTTFVVPLG